MRLGFHLVPIVANVVVVYRTSSTLRSALPSLPLNPLSISDVLAYHRSRNARVIGLSLACVNLCVALFLAFALSPPIGVLRTLVGMALVSATGLVAVGRGYRRSGVLLIIVGQLVGHVAVVISLSEISIVPLCACVAVLIAAATLGAWAVTTGSALALVTIGIETWLAMAHGQTRISVVAPVCGGILLLSTVAIIAALHVREVERAVAVAEERDRLRRQAVADTLASEERYRLIADHTDDLIALVDEQGSAYYLSPSHKRRLGVDMDTWSSGDLFRRVHPDDVERTRAALSRAREVSQTKTTIRFRSIDEGYRTYASEFTQVMRDSQPYVAIISHDVTERNVLELELQKAQRMEALGRLAAGVAHDFNNLLTVIGSANELALESLAQDVTARQDLIVVRQTVARASDLTQQLLTFSRRQATARQPLDVVATFAAMSELVQQMVGAQVVADLQVEPDCPNVNVTKTQLEQIVMNLATNARDAMPNGGRFSVVARCRPLIDHEVAKLTAGDYLEIVTEDTGTGIEPQYLPHLFEPFFTTKAESRGTGLGLATCYGIATQCGGTILVETRVGTGSIFRILRPAADSETSLRPSTPRLSLPAPAGQRVLLVNDDPALIQLATRMLVTAGYAVTAAESLVQAEQQLNDTTQTIDILLSDVVLGNDLGTVLAKRALATRPNLRVVLMSGCDPDPKATVALLGKRSAFLPKPFDRQSLMQVLNPVSSGPHAT